MNRRSERRYYLVTGSLAALAFVLMPLNAEARSDDGVLIAETTVRPPGVSSVQTGGDFFQSGGPDVLPFPRDNNGGGAGISAQDGSPKYPLWYLRGR